MTKFIATIVATLGLLSVAPAAQAHFPDSTRANIRNQAIDFAKTHSPSTGGCDYAVACHWRMSSVGLPYSLHTASNGIHTGYINVRGRWIYAIWPDDVELHRLAFYFTHGHYINFVWNKKLEN